MAKAEGKRCHNYTSSEIENTKGKYSNQLESS